MERDSEVIAFYRISEKKQKEDNSILDKIKPEYVTNENCLRNFRKHFTGKLHVFGDNLKESKPIAKEYADHYHDISEGSNAGSLSHIIQFALDTYGKDDILYFVEDDYIHRGDVVDAIKQGLDRVDFVTLYDHPDKYMQWSQPFHTKDYIWRLVESTTMTFAVRHQTLYLNYPTMKRFIAGKVPNDHYMFKSINPSKTRLASVVPGLSTHGESNWLSPTIKWEQYV
jgi:hypothetical protein